MQDGKYIQIPRQCIETLVGVNATATHAYRQQQARPDHPAFLCLSVKPQYYQIILSEPCGVVASPRFPWSELGPLASFFHTIYVGSDNHVLHDNTVLWKCVPNNTAASIVTFDVSWLSKCGGEWYTDGDMICDFGDAWGRRTTVFSVTDPSGQHAVIKEYYWHQKRRFEESNLLAFVHADGDVPGVVRMICCEDVVVDGRRIECGAEGDSLRMKKRMALYDYGYSLLTARSVNALLRGFYDALEGTCSPQCPCAALMAHNTVVHRTLMKRGILHRDMSINNILIRPVWRDLARTRVMKDPPPLIEDVLSGVLRCVTKYLHGEEIRMTLFLGKTSRVKLTVC